MRKLRFRVGNAPRKKERVGSVCGMILCSFSSCHEFPHSSWFLSALLEAFSNRNFRLIVQEVWVRIVIGPGRPRCSLVLLSTIEYWVELATVVLGPSVRLEFIDAPSPTLSQAQLVI